MPAMFSQGRTGRLGMAPSRLNRLAWRLLSAPRPTDSTKV